MLLKFSPIAPKNQDFPHCKYPNTYLLISKIRQNCSKQSWLTADSRD